MTRKKRKEVKVIKETAIIIEEIKPKLISFETWWFMRSSRIPRIHAKEIVAIDFKSRGLGKLETVEDFDAALVKYGVKL